MLFFSLTGIGIRLQAAAVFIYNQMSADLSWYIKPRWIHITHFTYLKLHVPIIATNWYRQLHAYQIQYFSQAAGQHLIVRLQVIICHRVQTYKSRHNPSRCSLALICHSTHPGALWKTSQIARFTCPTWSTPGSCRPQAYPMLAPWTLLSWMVLQSPLIALRKKGCTESSMMSAW